LQQCTVWKNNTLVFALYYVEYSDPNYMLALCMASSCRCSPTQLIWKEGAMSRLKFCTECWSSTKLRARSCLQPFGSKWTTLASALLPAFGFWKKTCLTYNEFFLQRDNKNRYVMAYAQMLVDMEVFQTVEFNFLPVGHTHCDIDQLFSRVSVHLYANYCLHYDDLLEKVKKACSKVRSISHFFLKARFHGTRTLLLGQIC